MHKLIKDKIDSLKISIIHLKKLEEPLIKLEKVLVGGEFWIMSFDRIGYNTIVSHKEDLKKIYQTVGKLRYFIVNKPDSINTTYSPPEMLCRFKNKDTGIDLNVYATPTGSSCEMVKTGETVTPKYEMICE